MWYILGYALHVSEQSDILGVLIKGFKLKKLKREV